DRRQVLVRLTERGAAVLRELSLVHRAQLQSTGPRLVQALAALLGRIGPEAAASDGEAGQGQGETWVQPCRGYQARAAPSRLACWKLFAASFARTPHPNSATFSSRHA